MTWLSVRVRAPEAERPAIISVLFDLGSQGVQEDGEALVTHFPAPVSVEQIAARIHGVSATADIATEPTPEVDWSERWRDRIGSHDLGPLIVAPPWLASPEDAARTIVIDPGMAFGTGDHPTTRGAARLLQEVVSPGLVVADLGAGSAVLAIAAARLGASRVFAIEYDHDAIADAEENVRRNGVESVVHVFEGDAGVFLPLVAPVDVVVANIISSVLVELLPAIHSALRAGGKAVFAGVLLEEKPAMLEALSADDWLVEREDTEDVWWSLQIART